MGVTDQGKILPLSFKQQNQAQQNNNLFSYNFPVNILTLLRDSQKYFQTPASNNTNQYLLRMYTMVDDDGCCMIQL